MEAVIKLLREQGWIDNGTTQVESYRTASLAYGGGLVIKLGGRVRLWKGLWKVTVGKRTVCFYRKPDNPETLVGTGRLNAGRRVYTFRDWEQTNIPTKDLDGIRAFIAQNRHIEK